MWPRNPDSSLPKLGFQILKGPFLSSSPQSHAVCLAHHRHLTMALERTLMILSSFFSLIYIGVAGFGLWLAWQFVQAFISIARSLEDIAATYRRTRTNPSSGTSSD